MEQRSKADPKHKVSKINSQTELQSMNIRNMGCASRAGGRITGKISVRNCSRMQDASQAETERDGRKDRDITKDRI